MLELKLTVLGQEQLNRRMGLAMTNVSDLRPAWPDIRKDWIDNERRQFASQGMHGSGGWRPLSSKYAAWKKKHYPGKTILRRTDNLFRGLTNPGHPDFIYRPAPLSLMLGTLNEVAVYHQGGTKNMPAREPVELTEAQKRLWPKLIQTHIWKSGQGYVRETP